MKIIKKIYIKFTHGVGDMAKKKKNTVNTYTILARYATYTVIYNFAETSMGNYSFRAFDYLYPNPNPNPRKDNSWYKNSF